MSLSPAHIEDEQVAAKLVAFMGELTGPLLPERERYELLVLFSLLSGLAFAPPPAGHRRAALCSDGTPLEMSLAFDDQGRHSLRFVCDVSAGMPTADASPRRWLRGLADTVVPGFDGRRETLDRLFARHLDRASDEARFWAWFGAGASPGSPHVGMVYFNTEWLSTDDVAATLAPSFQPPEIDLISRWPAACGADYKGVAYDFDVNGLRKAKLYLRPDVAGTRELEGLLPHFPGSAGERLLGLFHKSIDASDRARDGSFVLALGLPAQPAAIETTLYLHLESWGVETFEALAPILRRLVDGWDFDLDGSLSAGPRGCTPTLLSLSVSEQRQRLAVYFKPRHTQS